MPTHLIIVPAEDPSHGIRILYATVDGAGSLSPSYIDGDGIAHKVPYDHVFNLADTAAGYHVQAMGLAIERLTCEAFPALIGRGAA